MSCVLLCACKVCTHSFNIEGVQVSSAGCSSKGFKKIERGRRLTDCESNFFEQFSCKSRKKDIAVTVRAEWWKGLIGR